MKFIIDQQLPPALVSWLNARGHDAEHVRDIGMRDAADNEIWQRASMGNSIIVTKDEDFCARRSVATIGPAIVWVRLGNVTTPVLLTALEARWDDVVAAIVTGAAVIEVR